MCDKNTQSFTHNDKRTHNWVIVCYGNILRSQVLEQYLRHYSKLWNIDIGFFSAGVADPEEFPDKDKLFMDVRRELQNREIPCSLQRNTWNKEVEEKTIPADVVICADNEVKATVLERMDLRINKEKVFTFYEIISEGEVGFQDTYDYEKKQQDPIRFQDAFNELDRIARKLLHKF